MKQLYKSIKIEIANELNQKEQKRKRKKRRKEGRNKWKGNIKILIQREFIQFIYIRIILELIREREKEREIYPTNLFKKFIFKSAGLQLIINK